VQERLSAADQASHYFRVSRITNAAAVFLPVGAAYFALGFQSLMQYSQMILSTFNTSLFARVALASSCLAKQCRGRCRVPDWFGVSVTHQVLALIHMLLYGSQMAADFVRSHLRLQRRND
jgi:hypothetical protein